MISTNWNPNFALSSLVLLLVSWLVVTSPAQAQVVINEFDPISDTEWIEFYNASPSAEYLKSYFVDDDISFSDDAGNSSKWPLVNINTANPTYPYIEVSSYLNNSGDYVVLFGPGGELLDDYHFDTNPGEVTIGRSPDKTGNFYILSSVTKGSANSQPTASPVITPTPPPSPTLLPSPKSIPTPKPAAAAAKKSTPASSKRPSSQPSPVVLGEELVSPTPVVSPSPVPSEKLGSDFPVGLLFIAGGILFSGAAGYILYKKTASQTNP